MKNKLIQTRLWALIKTPAVEDSPVLSVGTEYGILFSMKKLTEYLGVENNQTNRLMLGLELRKICYRTGETITIRDWV